MSPHTDVIITLCLFRNLPRTRLRYAASRVQTVTSWHLKGLRSCESIWELSINGHLGARNLTSTGAIPSSLNPEVVFLSHNFLGGPIPQGLLGEQRAQKCVVAKALVCPTCYVLDLKENLYCILIVDCKTASWIGVRTSVLGIPQLCASTSALCVYLFGVALALT
eukprot:2012334-Amphidinium_carterae.1